MMEVRDFKESDMPTLDAWCEAHGKSHFPTGWLPPTGYIIDGVVAAFLYRTDSEVAFLENVISCPESTKEQRREALFALSKRAEEDAKKWGCKFIVGLTSIKSLAETSRLAGYSVSEPKYSLLVKGIYNNE